MRGSIRKWMVVGALASASLVFPACSDTNRGMDTGMQEQTGTGGAGDVGMGDVGMEDQGIGGSGGTKGGTKGGTTPMGADAGTAADAGTGGTGLDNNQDVGTSGQGVTGDDGVGTTRTPSGGVPGK